MTTVFEAIKSRRSIRKYKDRVPDKEIIKKVIKAANWAPSNGNSQPWSFYVVKGDTRKKICDVFYEFAKDYIPSAPYIPEEKKPKMLAYAKDFGGAPIHIVVAYKVENNPIKDEEALMAASAAVQNLCLSAWEEGLGTVWIAGHVSHDKRVIEALDLSDDQRIAGIIPTGIPDMEPTIPPRKDPATKTEWMGF